MIPSARNRSLPIVIAEDDEDDRLLMREAFSEQQLLNPLFFVCDGIELLSLLRGEGRYAEEGLERLPGLILLDLNMPRMDGREALRAIKADARLRCIPVTILTTSKTEEDILRSYELGVNSFVTKPVDFPALSRVVRELRHYWIEIVALPPHED